MVDCADPAADERLSDVARLFTPIATAMREIVVFAYLDAEWRLLGLRHVSSGSMLDVALPVREVVADVVAFGAAGVVMAHNHPAGDATPSAADYAVTNRLARALDLFGVALVDHLILAGDGHQSFRRRGLL